MKSAAISRAAITDKTRVIMEDLLFLQRLILGASHSLSSSHANRPGAGTVERVKECLALALQKLDMIKETVIAAEVPEEATFQGTDFYDEQFAHEIAVGLTEAIQIAVDGALRKHGLIK